MAGESASGKTQLCMQLCITVQLPKEMHGLDSGKSRSMHFELGRVFNINPIKQGKFFISFFVSKWTTYDILLTFRSTVHLY